MRSPSPSAAHRPSRAWPPARPAAAPSVEIRDAVARVTVIPEDRADIKVEFLTTNADAAAGGPHRRGDRRSSTATWTPHPQLPRQRRPSGRLGPRRGPGRLRRHAAGGDPHAHGGRSSSANGVVFGAVGRSASLDLAIPAAAPGPSPTWRATATLRRLRRGLGADGLRRPRLTLRLSGAGEIHATRVRQGLEASLSGVGSA